MHSILKELILQRFQIEVNNFSAYGISKYLKGSKLSTHSDTGVYNTKRLITCLLYLKSAEKGGNLIFPEIEKSIDVEPNMLICFYSELKHEVSEIIEGERAVMILFAEAI